jgi:hypothetical protein
MEIAQQISGFRQAQLPVKTDTFHQRRPRLPLKARPGEAIAEHRRQRREIRSYEAEHVGAPWHLDICQVDYRSSTDLYLEALAA